MPAAIPAVIGLAAGLAASAATTAVLTGVLSAVAVTVIAGVVGAVVATGVSMLAGAVLSGPLGLNKKAAAPGGGAPSTLSAQDRKQAIRQSIAPRQIIYGRARVGGTMVYSFSFGADSRYLGIVSVLAGHQVDAVEEIWINDEAIPSSAIDVGGNVVAGRFAGKVRVSVRLGDLVGPDPQLIAESPDGWSDAHRLVGCAYIYVRLEYDADLFAAGLRGIGATVRGKSDILDPRTGFSAWTDNWALCVLDYLRSPLGMACASDELDTPFFIAAANLSDELVPSDGVGGTHTRYRADGAISLDATRREILSRLLTAGAGTLVYVQGRYRLYGGAYTAPTDSLGVSELAGPIRVTTKPPRRDLFNAVKGVFIDPGRFWQAAEFPAVTSPALEADDGERLWRDLDLPFTRDPIRAQRLARMELLRGREALTIEAPVQYRGVRYAVWQMLSVTIPDLGLTAKPMRVISWRFSPPAGQDGPAIILVLREETANAFAWSGSNAIATPAPPSTTLASPFAVPAPGGLGMAEQLYATREGSGVRTRAVLSWAPAASPFVVGYDVQFRLEGGEWRQAPGTLGETTGAVDDLADGLYEFRVRARTTVSAGAWATLTARVGALAAQPPPAITGLAVQSIGGLAYLRWDRHPDLDVRIGGRIEFRHTPDDVSPSWVGSTGIGEAMPGDATFALLPLKPGAYLAKAVDAGGRYSVAEAVIRSSQATALLWTNATTLTEHPLFTGALTNTIVTASTLRLNSGGLLDPVASFDAIADLDGLGGIAPSGSYNFSGGIDLGVVKSVRATGRLLATVVNTLTQVDQRAGNVDAWLAWDDTAGGEADAWTEIRETNDNPLGSPTWSAWRRLDASEFRARAFQFRAQLRSYDIAFNIHLSQLSVTVEEVI